MIWNGTKWCSGDAWNMAYGRATLVTFLNDIITLFWSYLWGIYLLQWVMYDYCDKRTSKLYGFQVSPVQYFWQSVLLMNTFQSQSENFMHIWVITSRSVETESRTYCQISNISHTKSQGLIVSRPVLHLSLPNPMQPGVKSKLKM